MGLCIGYGIESQKPALEKLVTTYLSSDLFKRIHSAKQVLKEVPFSYFQDGILYEGYIDLMFEENGGFVIVDLKTDQINEAQLAERTKFYSKQLEIYETALKQLNMNVTDKVLYFVRLGRNVTVQI